MSPPSPMPLRQDLRLHESGPSADGAPMWSIQDPVRNRFYQIGWLEYECLRRWPNDPERIAAEIAASTPLAVDADQVKAFWRFLAHHQLLRPADDGRQRLIQQLREPGWRHWRWWLHHYLFIRLPLFRPERFLARVQPWLNPFFSSFALFSVLGASLLGLILVGRQWESFTHSLLDILTPTGLIGFLLALALSKMLHELGHALVATRQGVRVAHMGVAFLVLWPMLYTDTSESWRLRSHRQRLAISMAGISVEMALAGLATLTWALLDDGVVRQAALYLATTSWVLTLALNISPFMRFDGYFILSDLLNFPNLHERASAVARVWLRRVILGFDDPWPEYFPDRQRHKLVLFALTTWVYRLVIFLGIAWAVYAFFFKALGIFLMAVEIVWFVLKPAWSELSVWKARWNDVAMTRRKHIYLFIFCVSLIAVIPWRFEVAAPGVAHAERQHVVYAPFPAQLVALQVPGSVSAGAHLALFDTPDVEARETRALAAAEAIERRLAGLLDTVDGVGQQMALSQRLDEQQAEVRAARDELGRLSLIAGFAGEWRDVDQTLRPGAWLGTRQALGVLVDNDSWVVDAYVEQHQVERIKVGAQARFLPSGHVKTGSAEVLAIDTTQTQRPIHSMLDSRYGGVLTTRQEGQEALPAQALYRVRLRLSPPDSFQQRELRGKIMIEGTARSLAWEGIKGGIAVLIRESGF